MICLPDKIARIVQIGHGSKKTADFAIKVTKLHLSSVRPHFHSVTQIHADSWIICIGFMQFAVVVVMPTIKSIACFHFPVVLFRHHHNSQ